MAIVIDKANIGTNVVDPTATTIAFNTTQTVVASGFIVICVGWFSGSTTLSSVAGGSLTWAVDMSGATGVLSPRAGIASAQAPSGLASGTTITATLSTTAPARTIGGMSFTGVVTSAPLDGTTGKNEQTGTTGWTSGSRTLAAGSVLVASCFNEGAITGSTTVAPSLEAWEVIDGVGQYGSVCGYRIESSAGSYAVAGTWDAAHNECTSFAAYLAAAGAAAPPVRQSRPMRSRGISW